MRRTFMVSLASALLAVMAVSSAASAASWISDELVFWQRDNVYKFRVQVDGGTTVRADTMDCCVEGDNWGVTLVRPHDGHQNPPKTDTACGNGSTTEWSGLATMAAKSGKVIAYVFNCTPFGEGAFPAGMNVRFRYNGTLTVTQTGGPPGP
jgi:hypothetical protein